MNALIFCHAGARLGMGHLMRSLVAARALRDGLGMTVQLLIHGDRVTMDAIREFKHQFLDLRQSLKSLILTTVSEFPSQVVLLDIHPNLVPDDIQDILAQLRQRGCRLVAIDGLLEYRDSLDLIFIPSFRISQPIVVHTGAPIVYGWDCFLLNVTGYAPAWRRGNRVLALTGGSDATELGDCWPEILDATLAADTNLCWVTGPFAKAPRWPQLPRTKIQEYKAPQGLGSLMQETNYAVTVFGVSFFELLYYGVPTVVFSPYGGKDTPELEAIIQLGLALVARDAQHATHLLAELMGNESVARAMSMRARSQLKVLGSTRLCAEIAILLPSKRGSRQFKNHFQTTSI